MQKKILIFSLSYYPKYVGGAEVAIKEITDRIPSSEIEFHMVTLRYDSALPAVEKIGNILIHRIGFTQKNASIADLKKFPLFLNKFLYQLYAPFFALSLNKKHSYDALWAMMAHATGIAASLFKLFKPRVPYILTLQEGDPPEYVERLALPVWPLFKRAFTKADRVQVISTFLGKWATRMGFPGEPILIPNAVDVERFSRTYPESELEALKDSLGKKMGDVFLITTSRLVHKNAVDDVIRALRDLPDNVHFLVLGTGPDEEKLKRLAERLRVKERVMFIGQVDHEELPKYLKVSDIFIRPSRSEGMGNSFVEAFAVGIPVIATQEGGLSDLIFDEKRNPDKPITGWAVSKDSPKEITDAVLDVMSRPEKVRAVVRVAKALAHDVYDWNLIARDMKSAVFNYVFVGR
jgi:glycosyltransferase involved in cell wall biosynthesis